MKQQIATLLVGGLLAVVLFGVTVAGPFEDARVAYRDGNYSAALQLWRPLADGGDLSAQFYLGEMYRKGEGVPQDFAQAINWYRKAADQGQAIAPYLLGVLYEHGQGAPQDYVRAYAWYDVAVSRAHIASNRGWAAKARELIAAKMTPAQISEGQEMARRSMPK